jgi:hypothetical protein
MPYQFVNLVHGDVLGPCNVNGSSEVGIENNGHSIFFSKGGVSNRAKVSTKGDVVEDKLRL